ncbi:uncharacterized protein [Watersipora subatra]|uniref:uncharacterized protein n=1 Tax=Watersipora subatra TaxID=2589382 RepID=UPI00355B32C7
MANLTGSFHFFPVCNNELNRLEASSGFITDGPLYANRGQRLELSDEDVVNVRKEPIAIDLQVHEDFPDQRSIRQAPIVNLDRRISIPKDRLDLYYSMCKSENIPIKNLEELERERHVQNKIRSEKQHWRNHSKLNGVIIKKEAAVDSKQYSVPTRKLISDSAIHVQLNELESLPENLLNISVNHMFPHRPPMLTVADPRSDTPQNVPVIPSIQERHAHSSEISLQSSTSDEPSSQGLYYNSSSSSSGSKSQEKACFFASNVGANQKTSCLRKKGTAQSISSVPPYSTNQRMQASLRTRHRDHEEVLSQVKVETDFETRSILPLYNNQEVQLSGSGCPTPNRVVSGPPSPHQPSQRQAAGQFWRSHSTPSNLHSRVSLTRLEKLSDKLTGYDDYPQPLRTHQRRPIVSDVLNLSQEELNTLSQSVNSIKMEPVVPTSTPPESSDDDIIWDDEIAESETINLQHGQNENGALDIYADSDSEYLLDRVDELLQ